MVGVGGRGCEDTDIYSLYNLRILSHQTQSSQRHLMQFNSIQYDIECLVCARTWMQVNFSHISKTKPNA